MRDVARAVEALLDSHPRLHVLKIGDDLPDAGAPVYDGQPDSRPNIYATYYLTSPLPGDRRASGDASLGLYSLTTLCVGRTPDECRWVAESIHEALELARVTVPGGRPAVVTIGTAGQVRPDDSITPPATVLTDVWRFRINR